MAAAVARFRAVYGAHPLHLLVVLTSFAVFGYVIYVMGLSTLWDPDVWWQSILVWFLGAVVFHDFVLFPIYALADRAHSASVHALRPRRSSPSGHQPAVPALNFVRVPVLVTGLTFLLFFPGIIGQGAPTYLRATSQTQEPFLGRWLLFTAAVFIVSAIAYFVKLAVVRRRVHPSSS